MTPFMTFAGSPSRRSRRIRSVLPTPITPSIGIELDNLSFFGSRGGTTIRTLTLTRVGDYTGSVSFVAAGLPTGTTAAFSPSMLSGGVLTTSVTLTHAADAALVTADPFTITASGVGVTDVVINANTTVVSVGSIVYGPGPNAPAWSGKTAYPEELFLSPIPVHYAAANAAGFKGFQGFDGAWNEGDGGAVYTPQRVTYPTVSTPLGTKPVLQVRYPGSTSSISAINGTSTTWSARNDYGVRVSGTWSGTLVFERSLDGGSTWNPVTLRGTRGGGGAIPPSGSSATVNGVWVTDSDFVNQLNNTGLFRVRATAWSSGTATIAIGMRGGEASARFSAGDFIGRHKRVYTRILITNSTDWSDGTNTGTKGFFYSADEGRGHYTGLFGDAGLGTFSGLQFQGTTSGTNRNMEGGVATAKGTWADIEFIFIANDLGSANGVLRTWVNGTPYLNISDVSYFQAESLLHGFVGFFMDPTYGGGEAPPDNPNIFFQIAGWYRESAP